MLVRRYITFYILLHLMNILNIINYALNIFTIDIIVTYNIDINHCNWFNHQCFILKPQYCSEESCLDNLKRNSTCYTRGQEA